MYVLIGVLVAWIVLSNIVLVIIAANLLHANNYIHELVTELERIHTLEYHG